MNIDTDSSHITPADGNVFADLGFEPEEAATLKAESQQRIAEKLAIKSVMKDRSHDDAMAEVFREDPAYAVELLNSIHEDGDQGELLIALRQVTQAFGGAAKGAEQSDMTITLTRREALRLLEMIENPPPRNDKFLKALARYAQQKQS